MFSSVIQEIVIKIVKEQSIVDCLNFSREAFSHTRQHFLSLLLFLVYFFSRSVTKMLRRIVSRNFVVPLRQLSSSTPMKTDRQIKRIKLFDVDDKLIGVKTMAEAEAMAKKDHLLLVKKTDESDVKYASFKLFDPKKTLDKKPKDPTELKTGPKGPRDKKKLTLGANIGNNDIVTKAKHIKKFLVMNSEVQVLVYGHTTNQRLEEIYKEFEKLFPGLRFVQKIVKPNTLKFTILPDPDKISNIELSDSSHSLSDTQEDELAADPADLMNDEELEKLINENLKKKK